MSGDVTAGAIAGFSIVAVVHPLAVVRTRFQVYDGLGSSLPTYKNTVNAIFTKMPSEASCERKVFLLFIKELFLALCLIQLIMLFLEDLLKLLPCFLHTHFKLFELDCRAGNDGIPRYMDSFHVLKETARFDGIRGFYRGITPNLLKNVPAASITFIVYENVLSLLKSNYQDQGNNSSTFNFQVQLH